MKHSKTTVRILLLEDDIKTVAALTQKFSEFEQEMIDHGFDLSLVVLSEYSMVEQYINPDNKHEYDVVLLDRDCKVGGSFHALDFSKFDLDHIVSISAIPQWNKEAKAKGVKRVVLKDLDNIYWFAEKVMKEIGQIIGIIWSDDDTYESEPLFNEAVQIVRERNSASASLLQRELKVGYARAARMLDFLEQEGVIGPAEGNVPREVRGISDLSSPASENQSDDLLLADAIEVVKNAGKASPALLQRKLRIGYARAARLVDILEYKGIVGPLDGNNPRKIV